MKGDFNITFDGQGISPDDPILPPDKQIVVYETKSGKDLPPDEKAELESRARKLLGDRFGGLMSREEYERQYGNW